MKQEIPIVFPQGYKFHWCGILYHVVLSFLDAGHLHYVVKYYGKRKQWWHYEVISSVAVEDILRNYKHR